MPQPEMSQPEESRLEQADIMRILLRERDKLFAYIWSIVRDTDLADDVFQDVSMLVIERREEINSESHLLGWVRKAARLKALEALRARKRHPTALSIEALAVLEDHWAAYDSTKTSVMVDALRRCIEKLSPYAKQIVRLRYVEGMPGQNVAETMNRKVDTVYKALTRIHSALRTCVNRQIQEASKPSRPQ